MRKSLGLFRNTKTMKSKTFFAAIQKKHYWKVEINGRVRCNSSNNVLNVIRQSFNEDVMEERHNGSARDC